MDTTGKAEMDIDPADFLALATSLNLPPQHRRSSSFSTSTTTTAKPFTPEEQKLVNELEERIEANIVQLGVRPLDTAELSVQCKRIMREYGIGQRLFARTVMCKVSKSQGSLSELLSKPREWHKLTERGRDAFRRIFGWISDDTAIQLLCQLAPRKVENIVVVHPEPKSLLAPLVNGEEEMAAVTMLKSHLDTYYGNAKKAASSPTVPGGRGRQLEKVIARIHNHLAKTGKFK